MTRRLWRQRAMGLQQHRGNGERGLFGDPPGSLRCIHEESPWGDAGRGTHLGAQGPGGQHVAAVVEPLWLHLGVARPAEVGDTLELGSALEDLHVVHECLVALGDDGLVLRGRGTH